MGFETLLGNGVAFLLKNKFAGFATKSIPIALYVWNVFYIMFRTYDPGLVDALPTNVDVTVVGYVLGHDAITQNVGFFGSMGGLFVTAGQETAKQMAFHAVGKNTIAQWLIPILAKLFGNKVPK